MNERVAIFGGGPTKALAAGILAAKSHDIWILPYVCPELIKLATACFELHKRDVYQNHIHHLKKVNVPLYLQEVDPELPTSVQFPIEEVTKRLGTYFTNSISYMVALAIIRGYGQINLFGVEMELDKEYAHQRPSCEYFLGIATGLGIKVVVPEESPVLRSRYLYGYNERKDVVWAEQRVKELERAVDQSKKQISDAECQYNYYKGALDDAKHNLNFIR